MAISDRSILAFDFLEKRLGSNSHSGDVFIANDRDDLEKAVNSDDDESEHDDDDSESEDEDEDTPQIKDEDFINISDKKYFDKDTKQNGLIWIESRDYSENPLYFGVYSSAIRWLLNSEGKLLPEARESLSLITKSSGLSQSKETKGFPTIGIFMTSGGHYASAIYSLAPSRTAKYKVSFKILKHCSIHRYTTRRKQGGSQSTADQGKGGIHSAGSSLRRYNEQALALEISENLKEWAKDIEQCSLIVYGAPGKRNKAMILEGSDPPLSCLDRSKLVTFPFTTRRPTQKEILRCLYELLFVKVRDAPPIQSSKQPPQNHKQKTEKIAKDQEHKDKTPQKPQETSLQKFSSNCYTTIKRNKFGALKSLYETSKMDINCVLDLPAQSLEKSNTVLHIVANEGMHQFILPLMKLGADPTRKNSAGKTAYQLAINRETRNSFRFARFELEGRGFGIDWQKTFIDSPIDPREYEKKQEEMKSSIDRDRMEKADAEFKKIESSVKAPSMQKNSQKLPVDIGTLSVSAEIQKKLDRERRARAVEARFAALKTVKKP